MNLPEQVEVEALANPHTHLREGDVVAPLVRLAIEGGADVLGPMPNTKKGLITAEDVISYRAHAMSCVPAGKAMRFIPIAMVNEDTSYDDLASHKKAGIVDVKVYPYLRTTKSEKGAKRYGKLIQVAKWCGELGIKVHLHPEHPAFAFDSRDAEFAFLPILRMLIEETDAIVVSEHGTDARCIPHWKELAESGRFYVTITAHHLATDEDKTFGDIRATCKPPIKTARDRLDLVRLVEEDNPWVMVGPDDAPHDITAKHVSRGCCACGAYTSPFLLLLYAHALGHLFGTEYGKRAFVNFTSRNVRRLHGLPGASRMITLVRKPFEILPVYEIGSWRVEPFWAGQKLDWSFA